VLRHRQGQPERLPDGKLPILLAARRSSPGKREKEAEIPTEDLPWLHETIRLSQNAWILTRFSLFVELKAKPGKEEEVAAFLSGAQRRRSR
jgi:hypothetical protein